MTRPSPHQHHSVVNRNAHIRVERERERLLGLPVISDYSGTEYVASDLNGRLKVVADRTFSIVVPHDFGEGKFSYEDAPNPVNQLGPVHASCVPLVTSNDYNSFMAAFNKRSNFMQKETDDDIDDASFAEALAIIDALPNLFTEWDENDADRSKWLAKFDKGKVLRMAAAYEQAPFATQSEIARKDLSVKIETLIKRDDPEWAPRVIYAGTDVFNAVTGPASCIVMERLVELTRVHHVPIGPAMVEFAYKTDDVKLCKFLFDDSTLKDTIEGDFSRNDREQRSRVALIYDAWLSKLAMPQWFRTLLLDLEHYTVYNRRFGFKAQLAFQLATGTTSTTPRNSTYNATMFAVALSRQNKRARAVILGDDLLARINDRFDLDEWVKDVASFKMVLKAKAPQADGGATFLSRRIFANVDTPCMMPLLGKMLVRFNIRASSNEDVSDSAYMAGKSLSYAYECRHVPFIRNFFMERYMMEGDRDDVQLQDLTWFARTSNLGVKEIVKAIADEKVVIDDDQFGEWVCLQYDCDLEDIRDLFAATVLDSEPNVIDMPYLANLSCDLG